MSDDAFGRYAKVLAATESSAVAMPAEFFGTMTYARERALAGLMLNKVLESVEIFSKVEIFRKALKNN